MLLSLSTQPPVPVWPTQYTADMGCALRPLCQWGDAMPRISREEPVMRHKQGKQINLTYNGALFLITSLLTDRKGLLMDEK
jgi:hypothetical protein